jgi:hypothetical protein
MWKTLTIVILTLTFVTSNGNTHGIKGIKSSKNEVEGVMNLSTVKDRFKVNLKVNNEFQTNDPISIETTLSNLSDLSLEIIHGDMLFDYYISNQKGEIINKSAVKVSIGNFKRIPGKHDINEKYRYTIDNPGQYEVWAVAKFKLFDPAENTPIEIPTRKYTILVKN